MAAVRFSVEMVFDLPGRSGLLVTGRVLEGEICGGTVLVDSATGARTRVLGVEFETPEDRKTGRTTLVLERTTPSPVAPGRTLTSGI